MSWQKVLHPAICWLVFIFAGCANPQASFESDFQAGNAAYKAGDYQAAIKTYQKIIDQGFESAALNFNIGNSFMKEKQLGRAVLWYERAYKLNPRDGDIQANRSFARALIKNSEPEEIKRFEHRLFVHVNLVTLNDIAFVIAFLLFAISLLILAGLFCRWRFRKSAGLLSVLVIALVFHLWAFVFKITTDKNKAVILSTAQVKYEPDEQATIHYVAYEGWRVRILKQDSGWVKIQRGDGLMGWIPANHLESI